MQHQTSSNKLQHLVNSISKQLKTRIETESRKSGNNCGNNFGISYDLWIDVDNTLWLRFEKGTETHNITVPMPMMRNGVEVIVQNEVVRAACPFWIEKDQVELDYIAAIYQVILGTPAGLISADLIKASPYIQRMIYGLKNGNASIIAYRFQQAINEIINKMPLHQTEMNSYVMNNRLVVVDDEFDNLVTPSQRLEYQVNKARKYFSRGWTSIGLSDGTLADKNYILKLDLRKLSPFGMKYHNPQRNLYSTLGMVGDEFPTIHSQSSKELSDKGITRKGWNLFTAFVDIPDIFEDQIVVSKDLTNLFVEYDKRIQIFGSLNVKEGKVIKTGAIVGYSPDGESNTFDVICESAKVKSISESYTTVGGSAAKVFNVVITYRRYFKDGFKITNLHGNKGVVKTADLGYAVDPRTGKHRKIDVIVGAKTIGKRRNYGQILEALTNCVIEADNDGKSKSIVLQDDWFQPIEQIESGLEKRGFRKDGTWDCDTYAGKLKAVCGVVFWGVIKTPEDQIWKSGATTKRNGKEVRVAGLKLSHVEFRAIETRFGRGSAIMDEVMSYAQGTDNLNELLTMMKAKTGILPKNAVTLNMRQVRPLDQQEGTIVPGQYISGTVVDEFFCPEGFVLKLPLAYQVLVTDNGETFEGSPLVYDQMSESEKAQYSKRFVTDKLYIPIGTLRKCWKHATGKYGLSEVGVLINNVVTMSHRLLIDNTNPIHHRLYYNALYTFFSSLSKILGSKKGEISTYGMSVRYPLSIKAVASLSTTLPRNTVEIHRSMADVLKVTNGDVVLTERFPCLGFMSVRPQKVRITDDPMCKYVIRVSGNSLVSQNLDFDGDVLFVASFHTKESKAELLAEWTNPNQTCYKFIKQLNERKGVPCTKEYTLQDYKIYPYDELTNEEHAAIVEKNTGVKAQTGPVIALTYNIMRIVENSTLAKDQKMKVAVEMFLEKAAQSVFEQKHGGKSLYEIVIDGICTANVDMLTNVGFKRGTTDKLCNLVKQRAAEIGVFDLTRFHEKAKELGSGNIISKIVARNNLIYFASRATLEGTALLEALQAPAVDIPSKMFKWVTAGKAENTATVLDKMLNEEKVSGMKDNFRTTTLTLCEVIDTVMLDKSAKRKINSIKQRMMINMKTYRRGVFGYANYIN